MTVETTLKRVRSSSDSDDDARTERLGRSQKGTVTIRVTLSSQSLQLLEALAEKGVYGRTSSTVAARFIDRALEDFLERPKLTPPDAG